MIYSILIYIIIVVSFMIIFLILLQPSKQQDSLSLLLSDRSSNLWEHQKVLQADDLLKIITIFLAIVWIIISLILLYLA